MARIKSSYKTNADFERLSFRFNDIEQAINNMSDDMGMLTGNTLQSPEPQIPFVIGEEPDVDGIFPTFAINIPAQTEVIRVQLIRRSDNVKLASDASDAAAIARARRKIFAFRFEVSEDEAINGVIERRTDKPIKRRKNPAKNQIQLVRLIALNDKDAFAKNPGENPFEVTTALNVGDPIFPTLVVRDQYDALDSGHMPGETIMMDWDKRYFNIGTSIAGPSKPALNKIIGNKVNLETQASDAKVTFKIEANANNNGGVNDVSFEAGGYNEAYIVLQRVNPDGTPDSTSGGENDEPLKFGGPIEDTDQTFVLIDAILPLGARLKWKANIVGNGVKKERATPDMVVTFFAGGQPPTANIPELAAFTIVVGETDGQFTEVSATITQPASPALAVLLKRLQFFKTNPSGTKKLAQKISLLDEEGVFVPGASTTFTAQIKHKKNLTNIKFDATAIGINHTTAVPIKRDATPFMGNSTFSVKPTQPALALINTAPDSDTDEASDSFADFTVGASAADPAAKFADVGTDTIFIALRKLNGAADDDPDDGRIVKYPFPVEDLNATQIICRVRGLKTGRKYRWPRNIASNSGATIKSDDVATPVEFRAGQMLIDPTGVQVSIVSITQEDGNFVVRVRIIQTTPAVLLRAVTLFKDRNNGQGFVEIANAKVRIKDKPEFQVAAANQTLDIEINALKNTTAQIRPRVIAVGGLTKDGVAVPAVAFSGQPPTTLPSFPMSTDIITNSIQADGQSALVVIRVFASWMRAMTGQGGTGPGGSISFNDVSADAAAVVIADAVATGQNQEFKAADFDPTQNFADITMELTIGKAYVIRRNITFREGVPAKSQITNVPFNAGGRAGVNGFPGLSFSLSLLPVTNGAGQTDNTQAEAVLTIGQPTPHYLLRAFEIERKRNVDGIYKLILPRERILEDLSIQSPGTKTISRIVPIPRNGTFNIRARLIGLGDGVGGGAIRLESNIVNRVTDPDSTGDTGRPQWSGFPAPGQMSQPPFLLPRMRVRWKPAGLKVRANLPDLQVLSLKVIRLQFLFVCQPGMVSKAIYYNPETGSFQNATPSIFDQEFWIDIGKGINAFFPEERPTITGAQGSATYTSTGGLPVSITNDLLSSYNSFGLTYLQVDVAAINNFVPTSEQQSSVRLASTQINFPFVPQNGQIGIESFATLP